MSYTTFSSIVAAPITIGEWRLRLAELCRDCASAEAEDESALLRQALRLMALAPGGTGLADHLPPRARFDALLGEGAHDSAVLALLPEEAAYIISRSGGGKAIASVLLPLMEEEISAEADSAAMALLSALCACLQWACGVFETGQSLENHHMDLPVWQVPPGVMVH